MQRRAKEQRTELPPDAARDLLERSGQDQFLLGNEVDKLAALSGYTTITREMVAQAGTRSLDADVFDMVNLIQAGRPGPALKKLNELLQLQNDPIAITGALAGSYMDMYRTRCGMARQKAYPTVFKDFGYKGKDWRLRRASESAGRYRLSQLASCLELIQDLDEKLKSSPVDEVVLIQTAVCRLAEMRERR